MQILNLYFSDVSLRLSGLITIKRNVAAFTVNDVLGRNLYSAFSVSGKPTPEAMLAAEVGSLQAIHSPDEVGKTFDRR